jgi:hypothetical protein
VEGFSTGWTASLIFCTAECLPGTPAATEAPTNVHSGAYAVRINNTTSADCKSNDTGLDRFRNTFKGTAGHRLKFSFWIRSADTNLCTIRKVSISPYADFICRTWLREDFHWMEGHKVGTEWEYHELDYTVPSYDPG